MKNAKSSSFAKATADKQIKIQNHFLKHGWMVVTFPNPKPIIQTRNALIKKLREITKRKNAMLEHYHTYIDDSNHTETQFALSEFYRKNRFGPKIIAAQKEFFISLLGLDINVQSNPYLRITRPGKPQDNIGYHRDTFYGGSPYELSVLVPFVDVEKGSALAVLSGSHIRPESDFVTTQVVSRDVTKGSNKHKLGFPYAPKLMKPEVEKHMKPIPLKIGQALIFSLSTVHGSVENTHHSCRWSSDMRVMNALAPVDLSKRPDYYEPLSQSVVTKQAQIYISSQ